MIHSFDPDIAREVGIEAAVLYQNIAYWCEKNRLNNKNEHDGNYWSFNSIQAFCDMFPYMSKGIIYRNLDKLEKAGYIAKANYNKSPYDRTTWYADLKWQKTESSISQIQKMDSSPVVNEFSASEQPIPNVNTIEKHNIKERKKGSGEESFESIMDSFEMVQMFPKIKESLFEYIKMRKLIKKPLTNRALRLNIKEAVNLSGGDPIRMQAVIEQSIKRSWAGFFPIEEKVKEAETKADDFWKQAMSEARNLDSMEADKHATTDIGLLNEVNDGFPFN